MDSLSLPPFSLHTALQHPCRHTFTLHLSQHLLCLTLPCLYTICHAVPFFLPTSQQVPAYPHCRAFPTLFLPHHCHCPPLHAHAPHCTTYCFIRALTRNRRCRFSSCGYSTFVIRFHADAVDATAARTAPQPHGRHRHTTFDGRQHVL